MYYHPTSSVRVVKYEDMEDERNSILFQLQHLQGLSTSVQTCVDAVLQVPHVLPLQLRPQSATRAADVTAAMEPMYRHLLVIAGHVATLNAKHLDTLEIGASVPSWGDADREAVELIWKLGMAVAAQMLDYVDLVPSDDDTRYDIFVSYAGQDTDYVVGMLQLNGNIFIDKRSMRAGQTSNPPSAMFWNVLTARLVLSVTSYHYVQKKWPLAELMCGLARNKRDQSTTHSPLFVDAIPGSSWLASVNGRERCPRCWLDDVKKLVPVEWPAMNAMTAEHLHGKSLLLISFVLLLVYTKFLTFLIQ